MRIVGGSHRGRRLLAPEGEAVRPTSDRARESLFDLLTQGRVTGGGNALIDARVLDVFAGTGALGLEALSRGAAHATFMEMAPAALAALEQNIQTLGEQRRTKVMAGNALSPRPAPAPCQVILLDPPYGKDLAAPALVALQASGWIAADALLVVEMEKSEVFTAPEGFTLVDERRYGRAKLVFLRSV